MLEPRVLGKAYPVSPDCIILSIPIVDGRAKKLVSRKLSIAEIPAQTAFAPVFLGMVEA